MLIGCSFCSTPSLEPFNMIDVGTAENDYGPAEEVGAGSSSSFEWQPRVRIILGLHLVLGKIMHTHAQQAHGPLTSFGPFEELQRPRGDGVAVAAGRRRVAARDRREIAVTHLDRH